jgi:hypothetical protein
VRWRDDGRAIIGQINSQMAATVCKIYFHCEKSVNENVDAAKVFVVCISSSNNIHTMKAKKSNKTPVKRARSTDILTGIREVLFEDWNPSGLEDLLPEDVQRNYIIPIFQILAGGRSEQELLEFLYRTGAGFGGVAPEKSAIREHLRPVAKKLLALKLE